MNYAIIYSRMNSSRLPGKALIDIGGKPLLQRCIERVQKSKYFKPIIATSYEDSDLPICDLAKDIGVDVFRGSLEDVASRTIKFLESTACNYFARVNGDSPFVDGELLDRGFEIISTQEMDIITNIHPKRSFPYGMSVEILKANTFLNNAPKFKDLEREHITSFFYSEISQFKYHNIVFEEENLSNVSLVVDERSDLEKINKLLKLYPSLFDLSYDQILNIFKKHNK
ncbi:cytidylyltransferase domain-containing protein [Peredibacter starrii]|uniref:Spore coat polysaccharide biosynthesis protein SpsF n=1 Tax=Peredibacter starrii TaxID=28202 RepID=A0AAX4HR60_9BACT|nr:NTP transferase domain-containing protein [Peredibacter starrii]WPU65830.1 hypothetical protein SOO65_03640 [Peredibacter starrii]